jgi:hypothetical protein
VGSDSVSAPGSGSVSGLPSASVPASVSVSASDSGSASVSASASDSGSASVSASASVSVSASVSESGSAASVPVSDSGSAPGSGGLADARPWVSGPQLLPFGTNRTIYYALPGSRGRAWRLIGHLHGMCGGPSYACAKWVGAVADVGALVCPSGNKRCGDPQTGPETWEEPTYWELVQTMDRDLEASIERVEKKYPGAIAREGAILTAYSRGAYVAPNIVSRHPGRWPYLVLIEATASLSAPALRAAGVRAVALVAGERSTEIAGMRKREAELARAGFPVKLFVMPKAGHLFSDDIEDIMRAAFAFVLGVR